MTLNYTFPDLFSRVDASERRKPTPISGAKLRDEAFERLERKRANARYYAIARPIAEAIYARTGGKPITVDDVRAECPPGEDVSPTAMGRLFRFSEWRVLPEQVNSERTTCHTRKIAKFVKRGGGV
jgi:hypothetical protein